MITYKCENCSFAFSEADKAYDIATTSGLCPKCNTALVGFDIRAPTVIKISEEQIMVADTIASVFVRLIAGALGVLLLYTLIQMLQNGDIPNQNALKVTIGMPVISVAFIAYAIGGQKLLRKLVPSMAEKLPEELSQKKNSHEG